MKLPFDYEVLIPTNDSVRLLSRIVEGMDLKELKAAYSERGRNPAAPPEAMVKIMLYAYMEEIYSSRKIQKACERDINFMWLLGGRDAPSHNTINNFRKERLGEAVEGLFYQCVKTLHELGEVSYENAFPDGTKIEANANRYTFVWKKAVEKQSAKIVDKVRFIADEMEKLYLREFQVAGETVDSDIFEMIRFLNERVTKEGIEIVTGKGKRQSNEQKLLSELHKLRTRHLMYEEHKDKLGERGSYSKTDPDATFMRMKDDLAPRRCADARRAAFAKQMC
jgi:transposase